MFRNMLLLVIVLHRDAWELEFISFASNILLIRVRKNGKNM